MTEPDGRAGHTPESADDRVAPRPAAERGDGREHDTEALGEHGDLSAAQPLRAGPSNASPTPPSGSVYDWYRRALALLASGNPAAAAELLMHASAEEPDSPSVQEALARALFDARRHSEAQAIFASLIERRPDDDYAHFGMGLCLARAGRFPVAVEHLALAAAMRPGREDYIRALRETRATVRARVASGLPPDAS